MAMYTFHLTEQERGDLLDLIRKGKAAARKRLHAQVLLLADDRPDQPRRTNEEIAQVVQIGHATVARVRQRMVEQGLEAALNPRRQKRWKTPRLDGEKEAQLVRLACSQPPEGRQRWTLQLLADHLVELKIVNTICDETVRRVMKKKRAQAVA